MMAIKETVFLLLLIMLPVATKAKKAIKPRAWAATFFDAANDSCTDRCNKCCPAGWSAHGNSCYHILDSPTQKMSDARLKCQNMGGDLVIIRSAQENDFIFELVEKLNKVFGVWLGLQRKADSKFYWIDDTPVEGNYQNWNLGEPNDNGGIEDCGHMYGKGSSAGKWNDSPCDWGVVPSVVCQKAI